MHMIIMYPTCIHICAPTHNKGHGKLLLPKTKHGFQCFKPKKKKDANKLSNMPEQDVPEAPTRSRQSIKNSFQSYMNSAKIKARTKTLTLYQTMDDGID